MLGKQNTKRVFIARKRIKKDKQIARKTLENIMDSLSKTLKEFRKVLIIPVFKKVPCKY